MAQDGRLRVEVRADSVPVENAEVVVRGVPHRTDSMGSVIIASAPGTIEVTVVKDGFVTVTAAVQLAPGAQQDVIIELQARRRYAGGSDARRDWSTVRRSAGHATL